MDKQYILKTLKLKKLDELPEFYIKELSKLVLKNNPKPKKEAGIAETSDKYKLLLKLINQILVNIKKTPIKQLTEFKDIDRVDIINDINKDTLDKHSKVLCEHFDKWKIGYMRKTDNIVLNVVRNMIKDVGLKFVFKRKGISVGNNQTKMIFLYSIEI